MSLVGLFNVTGSYLTDQLGRKRTFVLFATLSAALIFGAFPAMVGLLAASWGLGGAMALGALAYGIAVLALLGLPETRGQELT